MKQSEIEKKILEFWEKDNTFHKSIEKKSPKGEYIFYDGPPFATGTPHYGHIVASLMKDMVPRYFTMQGFRVERRWGWDCHGLPIENIVEQEHGFKHKKDIEKYGVDKFNEEARSKVLKYADQWHAIIKRLGRWVDFSAKGRSESGRDCDYAKGVYMTMDPQFMESVWWVFKQLYEKGLLYEAHRSMHICPRCETTLAQSEVAQGYKEVSDLSAVVKFELEEERETYLLVWTTTPWTLPGNSALAVGEDIEYVRVKYNGPRVGKVRPGIYIFAKDILFKNLSENADLSEEIKILVGCNDEMKKDILKNTKHDEFIKKYNIEVLKPGELVGKSYKPLFPYYDTQNLENRENAFKIYSADFVNTDEGTGIVHIAPAFGEDDYNLSKKEVLPFIQHVNMDGTFKKEIKDFAGKPVKPKDNPSFTDSKIIDYLDKKGLLFANLEQVHSYPHCWRCDSPLLNYAASSWFVNVEKIKKNLLKNAKNIHWIPEHIKTGRFGDWLQGSRDWSISRQRFWGSVIPVWVCDKNSEHKKVIGSISELEELSGSKITDLHKHKVDRITFKCPECGGSMSRVPDVLDCWFESGSMPYAQLHYPFENEKKFKNNFPAEFIAEGVDQTRAWFYYLHVLSVALFSKPAFKNVIVNGIVLAEDGRKMSKRLNNYPNPSEIFEKYGADAMRYYLASSTVMRAEDFNFSEKGVEDVVKKVLLTIHNVLSFYKMYSSKSQKTKIQNSNHILDKWIISKTNALIKDVTGAYENYDLNRATRPISEFAQDLSTWYVRRSRNRFKGEDKEQKQNAAGTLYFVLEQLSLIMAPVMPFISEHVWQEIGNKKSVHLQKWPEPGKADKEVIEHMRSARQIVEIGLSSRSKSGIKIRQPLSKAIVYANKLPDEYFSLIMDELNVKDIEFKKSDEIKVDINTKITPELQIEGNLRELVRSINSMRKKQGLTPGDIVKLEYCTDSKDLKKVFEKYADDLKRSVIASELVKKDNKGEEIDINNQKIIIDIIRHT